MKIQQWSNKRKLAESWSYGYLESSLQKIESRVDKGAVMIVHVLSGWLASSYPIRRGFFRHISWRVSVRICHKLTKEFLPFRMKEWLDCCTDVCSSYKYGSDIGLKRLSYQSKIISINIRISLAALAALVCFLAVAPYVAFPILLQRASRKKRAAK